MEKILAEVCTRDQFTCQPCASHWSLSNAIWCSILVARIRKARWPGDYELQCTRCLTSGQHSLCEVVLEQAGGTYTSQTPTRD
jgi:hypothetical protein